MASDISFMDILGGATSPASGEVMQPESSDGTEMKPEEPASILEGIEIKDIVEFLKSKSILPKDFTWEESEGETEDMEEMEGEETIDDSLSYDKLMME